MVDEDLIPLTDTDIASRLGSLSGWVYEFNKLVKTYTFNSFTEAIQFVNGLVMFCNFIDHHPDITISYKNVRFELTRFSVGGKVTLRDFTVAQKIEDDFQKYVARKTI